MPSNFRIIEFFNVGLRKKIKKVHTPRILDTPEFFNKKRCVKCSSYIKSNTVYSQLIFCNLPTCSIMFYALNPAVLLFLDYNLAILWCFL